VARQAGVPVVLSTVAVNLRSCAPFGSRHAETLTPEERRRCDALQQEGARLEEAGLWEQASKAYRKALAIDPTYAELHFRLARCAWRGERLEEARRSFREALEWDTLRFRADSRINETIRRVATALGGEGVHLADSQRWLEARAPGGLPGHEVFLDHVHLSFKGNYLVSLALLAEVQGVLPEQVRSMRAARPLLSEHECARRLALTDLDRYMVAETMRRRLERPPFTGQLDHAEQIARFAQEMASLRAVDEASAVEAALQEYRRVLSGPSPHWSVRERYATILGRIGRLEDAEKEWRRLARELPLYPAFHLQLARTLRDAGRLAEAESSLRDVAALQPESALVSAELARLALQQGRAQDAVREARRAVALDPRDANALYVLARSLCRPNACGTGERKEAIALLGTALTITPESQAVRNELEALQRR
jgi:tetratricopeptide (TPR) repeat protein